MLDATMTTRALHRVARAALRPTCVLAACGWLVGCGPRAGEPDPSPALEPAAAAREPRDGPKTARWDVVDMLRESQATQLHPSDGGGRAWLEAARP